MGAGHSKGVSLCWTAGEDVCNALSSCVTGIDTQLTAASPALWEELTSGHSLYL